MRWRRLLRAVANNSYESLLLNWSTICFEQYFTPPNQNFEVRRPQLKMDIDKKTKEPRPTEEMMNKLLSTKFFDWKYEDEMRLFVQLDHDTVESGKYFYSFSENLILREIILGPKCELPIEGIRNIVADFIPPVMVLKSRIAFTEFKVRESKVVSRTKIKR